ncbi:flagellar hook protein FlgE [Sphingomonas sanguinis]|jgi:flagellar hook protein FlgE|uniref:Flagellar hook protein FlgE n=2 Tax=Sphingomonas sanguinis TaxID=33051 RepID=A0A7Y7URV2_9SPHN|nr:flagellar hook protein FlgE [Sphingomonas sanguinis]MBZ6383407.1 flagellar hook protein FlgE [Sphingomonas sanguinis]NNG48621.1 flagellar hook protein FlgE [Sphingomonas sanguinis]NNG54156.1 flagellar hook protein FlgE [Sphingomonas sanguinis]NVP32702.1 flagellar hook protein FlgE [Sphingomonas sanguinis]
MSFYTSLSGLQASQTDLSVISHNIANVGTNGFKKSHAQFADVMASNFATDPTKQVGSGVVVKANRQEFKEGNYNNSANALDLAISGDGFFAVQNPGKGPLQYTRNGAFQVDQQNYVTDSSGGRLQVLPVDTDGNVTATGLDGLAALQLPATSGEPIATKKVTMDLNLSSTAATTPMAFNRSNLATYNNTTITKIYDPSGNAMTLTNYYVRKPLPVDANGNAIQPTDGSSTWQVYSFVDDQQLKVQGSADPVELTFDKNGNMTKPTAPVTFDNFTSHSSTVSQPLTLDYTGTSQAGSVFSVASRTQDGKAIGTLTGVSVGSDGLVVASFSNGETAKLGKVALASFVNMPGLRQSGDSYWQATGLSGNPNIGSAGEGTYGAIKSSTLEGSNVDITEELVNLIAAQRDFQANAKALDTSNQISQTIFNLRS